MLHTLTCNMPNNGNMYYIGTKSYKCIFHILVVLYKKKVLNYWILPVILSSHSWRTPYVKLTLDKAI